VPAGDRLPSALRSTRPGHETCRLCPGRRSAPENLAERGGERGPVAAVVGTLERHPDFLRLLIVFAAAA